MMVQFTLYMAPVKAFDISRVTQARLSYDDCEKTEELN